MRILLRSLFIVLLVSFLALPSSASINRDHFAGSIAVNRSYVYDTLNNLTSESLTLDGRSYALGYGYSASGYLTSRSLPSGRSIAYTVDGLGRAQSVTHNGANVATGMDYHANDAVSGLSYGNGQVFSQTLTARQEPLRLHSVLGGNTALDLTYDYNKRGLIKSIVNGQDSSDNRVYGYVKVLLDDPMLSNPVNAALFDHDDGADLVWSWHKSK